MSRSEQACLPDGRWCVSLSIPEGDSDQRLPIVRAGGVPATAPQGRPEGSYSKQTEQVWPNLILLPDGGFLAGIETRTATSYSGGGGSATVLQLFRVKPDGDASPAPVLTVPIAAALMIRACFSERDQEQRRGACHDEYDFAARLELAGDGADLPELTYVSQAHAFPRGASRFADSTQGPRLKQSDLIRSRDPQCSVSRRFRFDAAAGRYQPDAPLPDCSAYTDP
ncbi:hypothetical protein [Sphingosinicella sp. BN140058]|uniref:hypothetical protein n=1 Tax=Sphingosinicella sp. BN140058 TaxID=1892855 RepID=UPI001011F697|nr:hypothetical protein [Sphingosinicella sp. BN140058]QAY79618.1 hypothetical protein ETR14_26035 [Sphingosinicella sp. BN140058]